MSGSAASRIAGSLLVASLILPAAGFSQDQPKPKVMPTPKAQPSPPLTANDVAEALVQALGGQPAWDHAHHICFTFASARFHCWDKYTGNHRLEGQNQQGQAFVVLENINTHEGTAYLNGQPVPQDQLKAYLDGAFQAWTNDTYWLLMPYKLRDPGAKLDYAGSEELDGVRYEKLHLTFDNVGLTPKDQYWAYINPNTGLMERWAFILQNQDPNGAPSQWLWQGWQKYGDLMLAPTRVQVGGDGKIEFTNITVASDLPDSVYNSPQPMAAATPGQPQSGQQQPPGQQQNQ